MSNKQDVNSKLFVLYLIEKFPGRTESDLVSMALSSLYLDYFTFHENLSKLLEQKLIYVGYKKADQRKDAKGRNEERVYLTEQGQTVLSELLADLPLPMKATVDKLNAAEKEELELKDNCLAEYKPESDGYYHLTLQLLDGLETRMQINLRLPDETSCKKMAKNWKTNSFALYDEIISALSPTDLSEAPDQ